MRQYPDQECYSTKCGHSEHTFLRDSDHHRSGARSDVSSSHPQAVCYKRRGVVFPARCELAGKHANLYLDVCGHGIQRMGVLDLAVKCAGPERVLSGSDYAINDPAAVIATIQASYLEDDAKEKVLGGMW